MGWFDGDGLLRDNSLPSPEKDEWYSCTSILTIEDACKYLTSHPTLTGWEVRWNGKEFSICTKVFSGTCNRQVLDYFILRGVRFDKWDLEYAISDSKS